MFGYRSEKILAFRENQYQIIVASSLPNVFF